jgi:hypothetical protein
MWLAGDHLWMLARTRLAERFSRWYAGATRKAADFSRSPSSVWVFFRADGARMAEFRTPAGGYYGHTGVFLVSPFFLREKAATALGQDYA